MAKKPPSPPTDDDLLPYLTAALAAGPLPLLTAGKKVGVFPAKAKGQPLADLALEKNWVEACVDPAAPPPKVPKKPPALPKPVKLTHARVTAAGAAWALSKTSPKAALEALPGVLARLTAPPAADPALADLARRTDDLAGLVEALRKDVTARSQPAGGGQDLGGVLAAFGKQVEAAVAEVQSAPAPRPAEVVVPVVPPSVPPTPTVIPPKTRDLGPEVVKFVKAWKGEKHASVPFDVVKKHLDEFPPALTPGEFRDLLTRLRDENKVALSDWGRSPDELPLASSALAFILFGKVMYYVDPA